MHQEMLKVKSFKLSKSLRLHWASILGDYIFEMQCKLFFLGPADMAALKNPKIKTFVKVTGQQENWVSKVITQRTSN